MNPPLVKTTLTKPVSARLGVATLIDISTADMATAAALRARYFLITLSSAFEPGPLGPNMIVRCAIAAPAGLIWIKSSSRLWRSDHCNVGVENVAAERHHALRDFIGAMF